MDPAPSVASANAPALLTAWPRSAQLTTAFLLGVAATLLTFHVLDRMRGSTRPSELARIDLNRANRAELVQLPGVSDRLAERIEDYRREHGAFASVEELAEVHGLGPATVERLRPWVRVEPELSAEQEMARSYSTAKKEAPTQPIDINHASAADLQRLPGIGPTLAQRIIDERQRTAFQSVDELRRVHGIGIKTLEKMRPFVFVGKEVKIAGRVE